MDRGRVAARHGVVAWCLVSAIPGCTSQLERFRVEWVTLRAKGTAPCGDAADCRELIERVDETRRATCGEKATCVEMEDLEREVRAAVLERFRAPCERGDAEACVDAHGFGYEPGLRAACDLGSVRGCAAACASRGGRTLGEACGQTAEQREQLVSKCRFREGDRAYACRQLGELIDAMSASNPKDPPRMDVDPSLWYVTPLLVDRPRHRYALDYLSRACFLGDAEGCHAVCSRRPDESSSVDLGPCRSVMQEQTGKSLYVACRNRDGQACQRLAIVVARMGFFDRDPAGFFLSGPGRVAGLHAMACQFGVAQACTEPSTW